MTIGLTRPQIAAFYIYAWLDDDAKWREILRACRPLRVRQHIGLDYLISCMLLIFLIHPVPLYSRALKLLALLSRLVRANQA